MLSNGNYKYAFYRSDDVVKREIGTFTDERRVYDGGSDAFFTLELQSTCASAPDYTDYMYELEGDELRLVIAQVAIATMKRL